MIEPKVKVVRAESIIHIPYHTYVSYCHTYTIARKCDSGSESLWLLWPFMGECGTDISYIRNNPTTDGTGRKEWPMIWFEN
jgi:hypothetical protein